MIDGLSIFLNTHSSCEDLLGMFFGQLRKHWPDHPKVIVAADVETPFDLHHGPSWRELCDATAHLQWDRLQYVEYSGATFGQQYLQGLSRVTTDFVLPLLEDMVLYADVDEGPIRGAMEWVSSFDAKHGYHRFPFRLIRTGLGDRRESDEIMDHGPPSCWMCAAKPLSMQPSLWWTETLLEHAVDLRPRKTPWEWETWYPGGGGVWEPRDNGPQRGRAHWDSLYFPAICTALNKGKWNLSEYPSELGALLEEYKIDPSIRGTV